MKRALFGVTLGVVCLFAPHKVWARPVISEIQYDPIEGGNAEFVELYNPDDAPVDLSGWFFADGITYRFADGTALRPGGYLVVVVDQGVFAALYPGVTNVAPGTYIGQLNNQGERLALADSASNVVFEVTYNNKAPWPEAAAGLGSSLVLVDTRGDPADPASWGASFELNGSPGGPGGMFVRDVVINEVLAHTDPPQEDAVELHNLTSSPVNISGWFLSDENAVRRKYRFPDGTVIPALGYLVVYQYQTMDTNSLVPFSISSKGDDIYLSEADASGTIVRYVDQVAFEPTKNGVSIGRWPDGTGDFERLAVPTFGVASPASLEEFRTGAGGRNSGPWIGPVVINEIMYHPADSNLTGRPATEYVELLNTSTEPQPLYNEEYPEFTWKLTGGISFVFPTNTTLAPGEYLLVVGTNDVEGFRQSWGLSAGVRIMGPFSNALSNAGDTVNLRAPNNPEPPDNVAAYHTEDHVKYNDRLPWPLAADGLGGALERIDPKAYANTADNWHSAPNVATPGAPNSDYVAPGAIVISEIMAVNRHGLRDEDGEYSDWIELYNTRSYDVPLGGWHLTDQASMPTQWTFPPVTIPAHGYLLVFASQKNRTNDVAHLHTNFSLDEQGEFLALFRSDLVREFAFDPAFPPQAADVAYGFEDFGNPRRVPLQAGTTGRYLAPTTETDLAADWMTVAFDDAGWTPATLGLGYDTGTNYNPLFATDLRSVMYNGAPSVFARFPFVVSNAADVAQMVLRMKFDDGFIAWLNGVQVALDHAASDATWNSSATGDHPDAQAVVFQDYDLSDQTFRLVDGVNVMAFQLLNQDVNSSDALLLPELQLTWTGGSTGTAGYAQGYLYPATPGTRNGGAWPGVTPQPVLSNPGGVFAGASLSVTVTCARADAELRYTLDGTVPTIHSLLYRFPISLSADTELIVRAFIPGLVPSPTAGAVYRRAFLGINELLASNATATPEMWDFTDFGDWIELYNAGPTSVDLGGYHLSDNLDQPFRWRIPNGASIPAGGYFLVWADGYDSYPGRTLTRPFWPYSTFTTRYYHSNFKLSAAGESIGLFSPAGSRIDGVTFGPQERDISYGRFPDGTDTWRYFGEPTAETANTGPALTHNLYRAPAVTIAPTDSALIVTAAVTVALSSAPSVTEIRYTTDSSTPTSASALYTGPFELPSGGIVRARAYAPDRHPGPVATRTFLYNVRTPDLPMISMVVDPDLLTGPVHGIARQYEELKQRDVPGSFELWNNPSRQAFQIGAGFRLYSLNTFRNAQKPFSIRLGPKYGTDVLAYQLFPEKPIGFFDRFVLRNGNDDWNTAFLRDTCGQQMLKGAIVNATQGFFPCAIYLNGSYYGLINIQEKMDEMYCVKNYGVELANVDFFENDGTTADHQLDYGTWDAWLALQAFVAVNDLSDPVNYAYVKSQVDIEDLVDYVAGQVFVHDTAWTHNRKWWRDRAGGRWSWCFVDLDRAFSLGSVGNNVIGSMASSMEIYRNLLANTEFRAYAAQRIMAHLNGSFNPARTVAILDAEADRIRSEMPAQINRFGTQQGSIDTWEANLENIRDYCRRRPAIAMQHVADYFSGGRTAPLHVDVTGGAGHVLADYVALTPGADNTFADGLPVTLTAVPDIGQTFVRWEAVSNATVTLLPAGSPWKYLDTVTHEVPGWYAPAYDDSAWLSGNGQLGYGDGDEATVLDYGTNAANKRITYYFRRTVNLPDPSLYQGIELNLLRDDGVVMYVNGREVLRDNLPAGPITIDTLALTNILAVLGENDYNVFTLSPTQFVAGVNTLAFEIHNSATNNADLGFDLELVGLASALTTPLTDTSPERVWIPRDNGVRLNAVFAPANVSLIPAVIASNMTLTAAGSPYYATGDIIVPSNTTLTAEGGVDILMPEAGDIRVQGHLRLAGTSNAPVRVLVNTNSSAAVSFRVNPSASPLENATWRWGGISFEHATHTGELVNVVLRGASLTKTDPVNHKAAISARDSALWMDGLDIDDVQLPIFVQEGPSTVLQNSRVHLAMTGDGINIKRAAYARVENCEMFGEAEVDADAIDYDGVHGGIIRGNWLHDFLGDNDDAIDTGEDAHELLIENNLVERFSDKGVSIGQATTATVRRNIIRNCGIGVGIKDAGSFGRVEHNTFHNTDNAVAVYEKNRGHGGGGAVVRNCIFSGNRFAPVTVDALSTAEVSYCLSDTEAVSGTANRVGEPRFERPKSNNFRLQTGSPAIDAGDPADPLDADGSRTDMGAVAFDWREGHPVITEIHYHPAASNASEFIELYNAGGATVDLGGWQFDSGVDLAFPSGTALQPGAYLVVAANPMGVRAAMDVMAWTTGVLDNAGETIRLLDAASNEIDQVSYLPYEPWPTTPDGLGPSLALISPHLDNALASSWYPSAAPGGTPGGPFDNLTPGAMTAERGAGKTFRLTFGGVPWVYYRIEYAPAMGGPWTPVGGDLPAVSGRVRFEQVSAAPQAFYRIRAIVP